MCLLEGKVNTVSNQTEASSRTFIWPLDVERTLDAFGRNIDTTRGRQRRSADPEQILSLDPLYNLGRDVIKRLAHGSGCK